MSAPQFAGSTVIDSQAMPRTAVFYTTIRDSEWGAPDYVWPLAAVTLLDRGIEVVAVVRERLHRHPQIEALRSRGAHVIAPPPLNLRRGRLSEIKALCQKFTRSTRALESVFASGDRVHVFIDQGGSFDFLEEHLLRRLITQSRASYDVIFRSIRPEPPLPASTRREAISFIEGAQRALFNSQWTRSVTELQLVHSLRNARCFSHIVRFPHEQALAWPADRTIRLASVSRLDSHHKGLDALLQALAQLPATLPPWTLDIFGEGPDEAYLRELAQWLGLGERIRFRSKAHDVRSVWQERHMLVLVSRYEGLGVAMLEAMACGRPVLRTPYGGCDEWIVADENGFVCPAPEPRLIAETLQTAIAQFDRWPQLGRAAHARIREQLGRRPESLYLDAFEL